MKQKILDLTKKLIEVESVSEKPESLKKVLEIVKDRLNIDSVIIKEFEINGKPSIVATLSDTKTPTIMLNGHVDVVPAENPNQFKIKADGDKLIARGSQDMKASCAVMIEVFRSFAKEGSLPKDKLGLMLVTDEEIGGQDGTKALRDKGFAPEFFLAGESTNFDIEYGAKGVIWLEITTPGRAAHAAYLWRGDNPITKITPFIEKVKDLYPTPKEEVWQTTCNISSINSGNATNRVPEDCVVKLDIRYIPQDNPDEIISKIKGLLPKEASIKILEKESFLRTDPKNERLQLLKRIAGEKLGKSVDLIKKHGASDARFYSEIDVPVTNFGPIGGGLHSKDEWVSIRSLEDQAKILIEWIKNA